MNLPEGRDGREWLRKEGARKNGYQEKLSELHLLRSMACLAFQTVKTRNSSIGLALKSLIWIDAAARCPRKRG